MHVLEAVYERDVDLLLLEEFNTDERFAIWFYRQVWGNGGPTPQSARSMHSVSDPELGESDLVVIYTLPAGDKQAILIEDKAMAPPQFEQAERYRQRGTNGIRQGKWGAFRTCLLAPVAYLRSSLGEPGYDATLSYEAISEALRQLNPTSKRHEYKVELLEAAVDQHRRGYTPRVHEKVTKFWHDYWEYATREFPELGMREPGIKPQYSHFIFYTPPVLPKGRKIVHKLVYGHVDLTLARNDPGQPELETALKFLLVDGLSVVQTGKSISIRARVPVLDHTGEVASQVPAIREALKAGCRLLYLAQVLVAYNAGKNRKPLE